MVVLIAACISLPSSLSAQPAANLLRNGDFSEKGGDGIPARWKMEKDLQPWTLEPAGKATENKPAITVTIESTHVNYGALEQTASSLARNTRYIAEARVKAGGNEIALLMIKLMDRSGNEIKRITGSFNAGTDWETLRVSFNSEEAAAIKVLCRYLQGPAQVGARVSFADVKLYEKKAAVPGRTDLYVSPSGKNGVAGTEGEPLLHIQEASTACARHHCASRRACTASTCVSARAAWQISPLRLKASAVQ